MFTPVIARRVLLSIIGVAAFLGTGIGLVKLGGILAEDAERVPNPPVPLAVDVVPIVRGEVVEQVRGFGLAQPMRRAEVAAQVRGEIVELDESVRVGMLVVEGQELARIDGTLYEAEVRRREAMTEQARADLARLQAELAENLLRLELVRADVELAERELARQESMLEEKVVSESAVDGAREKLQGARQRLSDSERNSAVLEVQRGAAEKQIAARAAELRQAERELENTTLKAPFAGRLDRKGAERGDYVQPGQVVFSVVDAARLELPIEVPASRAMALREGAPVSVATSEVPPRRATGTVERIAPSISTQNRTVGAYVVLDAGAGEGAFLPGIFLSADVEGRRFDDVIAIPRSAVVDGAIYLVEDGRAKELRPNFFAYVDDLALTRDDIRVGGALIVSGFERLYDGAPVILPPVVEEAPPAEQPAAEPQPATSTASTAKGGVS